jgi:hypothetical protein
MMARIPLATLEDLDDVTASWRSGSLRSGAGQYLSPRHTARGTSAQVVGRLAAWPWELDRPLIIDRIGIETTVAGGPGSVTRLGIYTASPTTDMPDTLLHDFGTIDTTAAPGLLQLTVSETLPAGLLWVATVVQVASPTFRTMSAAAHVIPITSPAGAQLGLVARDTNTVSGALPASFTFLVSAAQSFAPITFFREA